MSSSVEVPGLVSNQAQAPVSNRVNIPAVLSNKIDVPRHIPPIVSKSSTFDNLSAVKMSFEHGDDRLPVANDRVKIVNPNGYSLNYIPK